MQPSGGVALNLKGVRKVFDNKLVVIEGMDLEIAAGEFMAILGPSGCGKSTLLRMIARLAEPDGGRITIQPEERFQTAFVFQDAHLLPWRTVLDNAALPLELMGVAREARYATARAALQQVSLFEAEDRYPAQLSGGMRMRVSLARALVTEPRLLLLDEPFAALDEITRFRLDIQLRELWRKRGITVVFVTHSISEAAFLANRAVVLEKRGGRIKLDRRLDLPAERNDELRMDPRLGREMKAAAGRDGGRVKMRRWRSVIPALIPLVVVTAAAELAVRYGLVKSYLVPAPSSVLRAMIESREELVGALLTTSASALAGFLAEHGGGDRDRRVPVFLARDSAGVLSLRGVLPDGADHRHRAAAGDLVRLWDAHGGGVGVRGVDFPGDRQHAQRHSFDRAGAAGFVPAVWGFDAGHVVEIAISGGIAADPDGTAGGVGAGRDRRDRGRVHRRARVGIGGGRGAHAAARG